MSVEPTQAPPDEPYPSPALFGAAVATFFFPVISLIAALFLLSAEQRPTRRASLRTWAWVSAGWIALQLLAVVLFIAAFWSGSSSDFGP